jgi:hypothetical protein
MHMEEGEELQSMRPHLDLAALTSSTARARFAVRPDRPFCRYHLSRHVIVTQMRK